MVKWSAVIIGFILTLIVPTVLSGIGLGQHISYLLGLFLTGVIVGLIAKDGALGGLKNATIAGAFGFIVALVIGIIGATLIGGLGGLFASALVGGLALILALVYYVIFMGIGGAIGGAIGGN